MSFNRYFNIPSLLIMLGTLLIATGCASRPRYGASPRHKRGCDCPKWNAVPKRAVKDVHANAGRIKDPVKSDDAAQL